MSYLVDTDVVINFLYGQADAVITLAELRRHGLGISVLTLMDLFIAATAIEHGLSLVTRNTRDYSDIPGLDLYSTT